MPGVVPNGKLSADLKTFGNDFMFFFSELENLERQASVMAPKLTWCLCTKVFQMTINLTCEWLILCSGHVMTPMRR